jgi:tRNA modification GTPase
VRQTGFDIWEERKSFLFFPHHCHAREGGNSVLGFGIRHSEKIHPEYSSLNIPSPECRILKVFSKRPSSFETKFLYNLRMTLRSSSSDTSTIFALASAAGRAGVHVLRLSGPNTRRIVEKLSRKSLPPPRLASLRNLFAQKSGDKIDEALVLWFPSPNSFTGEDVAEFHIHGGRAILKALMDEFRAFPDTRLAEHGEFTRRAFENDKMDLTEAEAIADLIDAETEAQRKQALRQFEGALEKLYDDWADRLKKASALCEATIDFSDEDLPTGLLEKQNVMIRQILGEIEKHLADNGRGERLREGFSVAILGSPNAGKSSLLNALSRSDAAIVSPVPGTTRDVIEVSLDIEGYPVNLADTAGLREAAESIESEGVRRALKRAASADFKILVFDGMRDPDPATMDLIDGTAICIVNKADLLNPNLVAARRQVLAKAFTDKGLDATPILKGEMLKISAITGQGLSDLSRALREKIEQNYAATEAPVLTRARHRGAVEECAEAMRRALLTDEIELRAEDLRLALRAIGRITGKVGVDDILNLIFREFCIGK